jgi:N utilization substance protein B
VSNDAQGRAGTTSSAKGRELALLALCHLESYALDEHADALDMLWAAEKNGNDDESAMSRINELAADATAKKRARKLSAAVLERRPEIDRRIEAVSKRWSVARMSRVDRNLIRLAAAELSTQKTPVAVVIAEAVRLAGQYGNERSARFVNGIVDALARSGPRDWQKDEDEDGAG